MDRRRQTKLAETEQIVQASVIRYLCMLSVANLKAPNIPGDWDRITSLPRLLLLLNSTLHEAVWPGRGLVMQASTAVIQKYPRRLLWQGYIFQDRTYKSLFLTSLVILNTYIMCLEYLSDHKRT